MINHPSVETLRTKLEIPYNFYIEGLADLKQLLQARNFKEIESDPWEEDSIFLGVLSVNKKKLVLTISDKLFDDDKKLRFIKRTDWDENYVTLREEDAPYDDSLPL